MAKTSQTQAASDAATQQANAALPQTTVAAHAGCEAEDDSDASYVTGVGAGVTCTPVAVFDAAVMGLRPL